MIDAVSLPILKLIFLEPGCFDCFTHLVWISHTAIHISGPKPSFKYSVCISSYGCTREVWRAREKRKSCSRRSQGLNSSFLSANSIYAQLKA